MRRVFLLITALFSLVLTGWWNTASAWHIIGGELYYEHVSGTTYRITLKLYRDCYSIGAEYDDPAYLAVYGASFDQLLLPFPGSVVLPVVLEDPCLVAPPNVCVEEAIYSKEVTFSSIPASGITLVYQRCCRNSTILNIYDPADVGATYTTTIYPPSATNGDNSSPHFNNFPPIAICSGQPLMFDHSATDPDGDSLVYQLCEPYYGATSDEPQPGPVDPFTGLPIPYTGYGEVTFKPPYSVGDQLGGSPPMAVDPVTGLLTAFPDAVGQFVVGVCVSEYRNGQFIATHRRDFQFNVANCSPVTLARFKGMVEDAPLPEDTITICGTLEVDFNNLSINDQFRLWNFGDVTTSNDTSSVKNPSYTYPDTGQYVVQLIVNPGINCSDTAYKVVNIRLGVEASFTADAQCTFTPLQFIDNSVSDDGVINNWNWNFGDGTTENAQNPTHQFTNPGNALVELMVETDLGCKDTFSAPVTVYPTTLPNPTPADTFVCDLDTVQLSAGANGIAYTWSPDYEINNLNSANPKVSPNVTTTYVVQLTNEFNCIGTDSVVIQVTDTVIATAWPDTTVCAGQPVQLHAEGAVYYHWTPADEVFFKQSRNAYYARPFETSTYVVYSYIGSCFDVDTVHIQALPIPFVQTSEAQTINQGDTAFLHATGADVYSWSPAITLSDANSSDPLAFPLITTSYIVTGSLENGCSISDTTIVYVTHDHYLYIPNAFSPNGDGVNDRFAFFTKGIRDILYVRVYNRWGEKVFESEDWDLSAWDGTYRGKAAPVGVYVYVIQAETFDNDVLQETGNISLLR